MEPKSALQLNMNGIYGITCKHGDGELYGKMGHYDTCKNQLHTQNIFLSIKPLFHYLCSPFQFLDSLCLNFI